MELEELMSEPKELESEAPQCAQLQGAGPQVEYQQPAGPGGGRCKARGMACHRSTERVASQLW